MGHHHCAKALSSSHRFFVQPEQIADGRVSIRGPQAHQICAVLRLQTGDSISALDGSGGCHIARICSVTRREVVAAIVESVALDTEPAIKLTLAQALPKRDKVELVVQKSTELGISAMVVFTSERTVPKPADSVAHKLARWESIAREAAEQSLRATVPLISAITTFEDLTAQFGRFDRVLLACETERRTLLRDVLDDIAPGSSVLFVVGPEGGWSDAEVSRAAEAGAVPVSFGRRILRTETAAIAGCAIILHHFEAACNHAAGIGG